MLKNSFFIISLAIIFQACNNEKKTESGLEYKIIEDSAGAPAKNGDLVVFNVKYQAEGDSLNTFTQGRPVSLMVDSSLKGGLEEGLAFLSKGDSASFKINNKTFYKNTFKMDSIPGKKINMDANTTFIVKVVDVYTPERLKKERAEQAKKKTEGAILYMKQYKKELLDSSATQIKEDDQKIQSYLKKKKLNAQKTESGVYYVIQQEGTGQKIEPGDTVSVDYVGKLLDGTEFDKSTPGHPLVFQDGVGMVIPGFDEAMESLKEGAKATIIIPSSLGYGPQGIKKPGEEAYAIPKNAVLVFDIDVLKVTKNK
jgi:FKBP-type peptidyl-prolyl cis-trans isomerase